MCGVLTEVEAVGAFGSVGSPLQVVPRWGAGRGERRGSYTRTPPRCHVPHLLSPAARLERVYKQTTQEYLMNSTRLKVL